jgi:hypothetical protein
MLALTQDFCNHNYEFISMTQEQAMGRQTMENQQ